MKDISTLVSDIYELLLKKDWFNDELAQEFEREVSTRLQEQFSQRGQPRLRLSRLGPQCPCALWHSIHRPDLAEPIPPWAINKFSYGHILEAWALCLAKASGHRVEGEQDELIVDDVRGHRDCVIDGCIVDVKSCSSLSFQKFKEKTIDQSDSFGYLDQLDGYLEGSVDDPLVIVKDRAYILAIDKTLGHMVLYEHRFRPGHIRRTIARYKDIVKLPKAPACTCETEPEGKAGNIKLGVKASYSPHKWDCFPRLRAFAYAKGPVYLSHVARIPEVPEINRAGLRIA